MIRLTELGGVVVREAPNAAFGKGAIVCDPQGAPFGIMELASP
jgi:predicted enzyme related to lactoylglutathione lyase